MSTDTNTSYLRGLVNELRKPPNETPWVEFKHNNANPQDIGEYLSALSNAAATNSSLRKRFGIEVQNSAKASRIIKETQESEVIKPYDPKQGRKHAKYLPFWA